LRSPRWLAWLGCFAESISGGEIAGIVVGSVGGASLLIALAAVFVVRK
jgi:hypothetical protein